MKKKIYIQKALITAALIVSLSMQLYANGKLYIERIKDSITLDGIIEEEAWQEIEALPMTMYTPKFGAEPTVKTDVLLCFDDDYLYIGVRSFDDEPDKILAPSKKRDAMIASTDWFGVILDTYNDKENGVAFFTTPSGLRFDATVFNDAQGEVPINISWNTFWDVAVSRNNDGWFSEYRIPLSSLRYQVKDGNATMGFICWRWIPHKNEQIVFPAIPPNWGNWSTWKPSQAAEIVLEDIERRRPFYVTPYALGGFGQSWDLNDNETAYVYDKNIERQIGGDIKIGLPGNLTLDLTANTDFAQIEADDQEVNLTRFSLFFPEKRLFFQERSSNFDFKFDEFNRLFYSRRIGLHEGDKVPIYGGARLVGRTGPWDVGFINMHTAPVDSLSSENFTVLRMRRRVINPYSYVGGILTNRMGADGSYNTAWGADGIFRLFGEDYLTVRIAQTFEETKSNDPASLDPTRLYVDWTRRSKTGLGYVAAYSRAGADYNPGIGYEQRENFTRLGGELLYGWLPDDHARWYQHRLTIEGFHISQNGTGKTESSEIGAGWLFQTKDSYYGEIALKRYFENVTEAFDLSDNVHVPAGKYGFYGIEVRAETPGQRKVFLWTKTQAGQFYDGRGITTTLWPRWIVVDDFELSAQYTFSRINFAERQQKFVSHIIRLRALATLSLKFSILAFVQYNSNADILLSNVRLRYNPREGNDLYIVYDEGTNRDRYRQLPVLPKVSNRTILLKYSYTFHL